MSLAVNESRGTPKSFQSSAALHNKKHAHHNSSHINRSVSTHPSTHNEPLPSLNKKSINKLNSLPTIHRDSSHHSNRETQSIANSSLPSIHGGSLPKLGKRFSVEVVEKERIPHPVHKKHNALSPLADDNASNEHFNRHEHSHNRKKDRKNRDRRHRNPDAHNDNQEVAKRSKKDHSKYKSENRKIIKEQVAIAVASVREVFGTEKGNTILTLETKVSRAETLDSYLIAKVKRKKETDSLGISFTIPARVMALGWESGQHLVVTAVDTKPGVKSALQINDIVVAVDDVEVHNIDDLKRCVAGKKKLHFKCIRDSADISRDELKATQENIEKNLKASVKAKVKNQLRNEVDRDI